MVWAGYWRYTAFGAALAACAYPVSPALFLWMMPVLAGLGLAVPLVTMTASSRCGAALRRAGLLQITEERTPPAVLVCAAALRDALGAAPLENGVARLLRDPALLACHRAMLPPPRTRGQGALDIALVVGMAKLAEADTVSEAVASLSPAETAAVLGHDDGILGLLRLSTPASAGTASAGARST